MRFLNFLPLAHLTITVVLFLTQPEGELASSFKIFSSSTLVVTGGLGLASAFFLREQRWDVLSDLNVYGLVYLCFYMGVLAVQSFATEETYRAGLVLLTWSVGIGCIALLSTFGSKRVAYGWVTRGAIFALLCWSILNLPILPIELPTPLGYLVAFGSLAVLGLSFAIPSLRPRRREESEAASP